MDLIMTPPCQAVPLDHRLYSHCLSFDIYNNYTYTISSCSCIWDQGLTNWIMTLGWEPQLSTMHLVISNPIHISSNYGTSMYLTGSSVVEMGVNITLINLLLYTGIHRGVAEMPEYAQVMDFPQFRLSWLQRYGNFKGNLWRCQNSDHQQRGRMSWAT